MDRERALQRLKKERFDVLIIGGGITGCGIALDAAARGLKAGLIEREDFSAGTSSKSSKRIHGGLHVARKAAELGAVLANRLPATGFLKQRGRIAGVRTPLFDIAADRVVNASGVWCDEVRAVDDPAAARSVRPSKGVHLIVPARRLGLTTAAMLPSPDGRIVFLIPEGDRAIV